VLAWKFFVYHIAATKPLHEIESEAIEAAVQSMLAVRPDLNRPLNLALARMVAGEAVRKTLSDLRTEGHLLVAHPRTGAAPDAAGGPMQTILTSIDALGRMGRIDPQVSEAVKPILEGVGRLAETFRRE